LAGTLLSLCVTTSATVCISTGLENEGWFDPWSLLNAFRRKAMSLGVYSCVGEVTCESWAQ